MEPLERFSDCNASSSPGALTGSPYAVLFNSLPSDFAGFFNELVPDEGRHRLCAHGPTRTSSQNTRIGLTGCRETRVGRAQEALGPDARRGDDDRWAPF